MPGHKIPWYPRYPADFVTDKKVRSLSFAEKGLYDAILDHMWLNGCQLPANLLDLQAIVSPKRGFDWRWKVWLSKLKQLGLLYEVDGSLYNARLLEEWKKASEKSCHISQARKAQKDESVTATSQQRHSNVTPKSQQRHTKKNQTSDNKEHNVRIVEESSDTTQHSINCSLSDDSAVLNNGNK